MREEAQRQLNADLPESRLALLVTVGSRACALPLSGLVETMRPLPIEPVSGLPGFVCGVAMIRGAPTPVVDLAALLGGAPSVAAFGRFVTVKAGERRVALGVGGVAGFANLAAAEFAELPPLLYEADADLIAALGRRDGQLLSVLQTGRLLSEEVWAAFAQSGAARR